MPKIKGRIIRILDKRTVVINLGSEHGIDRESVFHILGEPEPVIDPVTNKTLGTVKLAKARVRASQVFDKFTIATTSWEQTYWRFNALSAWLKTEPTQETKKIDEGELSVDPAEIRPWKAKSESPVKVGDEVEVNVESRSSVDAENAVEEEEEEAEEATPGDG